MMKHHAPLSRCARYRWLILDALCAWVTICSAGIPAASGQDVDPVLLVPYRSYESCAMLEYNIPEPLALLEWTFILITASGCPARTALLFIQAGGYPVISHLNESFPPHFYLHRETPITLDLSTSGYNSQTVNVFSPKRGKWFIAAFLENEVDDEAIKPAGLSKQTCNYFLKSSQDTFRGRHPIDVGNLVQSLVIPANASVLLRVYIPKHSFELGLFIAECHTASGYDGIVESEPVPHPSELCSLQLSVQSNGGMPLGRISPGKLVSCLLSSNCSLIAAGPPVDDWYHITVNNLADRGSAMKLYTNNKVCSRSLDAPCFVRELPRTIHASTSNVNSDFGMPDMTLNVSAVTQYVAFNIMSTADSGGTLHISAALLPESESGMAPSTGSAVHSVLVCLQRGSLPLSHDDARAREHVQLACTSQQARLLLAPGSSLALTSAELYVPYPEEGWWYIGYALVSKDLVNVSEGSVAYSVGVPPGDRLDGSTLLQLTVNLRPCVDSGCGEHGTCKEHVSGMLHFTSCKCIGGWRGYGCTDGSLALATEMQLAQKLLLALSNLSFLCAAGVAIRRRWFTEAVVYASTVVSSSLYHICDGSTVFNYCAMPYRTLQVLDFVASVTSLWVTILAMAAIHKASRSVLQVAGMLTIMGMTIRNPTSLWNVLVPLGIGTSLLIVSLGVRCKQTRSCYPSSRKVWLAQLLPGFILAACGLILYAFVETLQNYAYVHSAWHIVAALAITILLPSERRLRCKRRCECFSLSSKCQTKRNGHSVRNVCDIKKAEEAVCLSCPDTDVGSPSGVAMADMDESFPTTPGVCDQR